MSDAFSGFHPWVNFLFFAGAIGFSVVIQHPAYILVSVAAGMAYCLILRGRKGLAWVAGCLPLFLLITLLNPIFSTGGDTVLFCLFGNPFTLESLLYGMAVGGIFVAMMLWFVCYSAVLTGDKFQHLFSGLIPALSLLLVMVLRLIPNLTRKAKQILSARQAVGIGVGEHSTKKEKLQGGITALSALTDWALEGSIITADSMRARGYGTAKRTSFQIYRMTLRDWVFLGLMLLLPGLVLAAGGTAAEYFPAVTLENPGWGLWVYAVYLWIPVILQGKEALQWRILISKM